MYLKKTSLNLLTLLILAFNFFNSFSIAENVETSKINELGSKEAKHVLVEYASMSCVHCANFHINEFKKIKSKLIDTGKLKFIYKDFPLDRPAMFASMVANCFSGDQYFEILSSLYRNQKKWVSASNNSGKLYGEIHNILKIHGVTLEKVLECVDDKNEINKRTWENILASRLEGQNKGVNSTPTFFFNDKKMDKPVTYEKLKELVK